MLSPNAYAQTKKPVTGKPTAVPTVAIRQMAYADSLRLVDMYKDLHQNPEL